MKTLSDYAGFVEASLEMAMTDNDIPELLSRAMRYSLLSGGKRLRSSMLLAAVEMMDGDVREAVPYACAVEMIHAYSLIHDDLPGMDDDVLRRGKPTNHVVFGVGQAILAGDGLLSEAFEHMLAAALKSDSPSKHIRAMAEIARGAGARGMVAGQCVDLSCEDKRYGGRDELEYIQENKTACMFIYPLRAACRLCGREGWELEALTDYARAFGHMFQTADDLLDVEGDPALLGKSVGKDEASGKLTAVSVYGVELARDYVGQYLDAGLEAIKPFGERGRFFSVLIKDMVGRDK
ncbi:MAG: polyprenyl synthetase family protein [Clostridia bacterium]|nr:polyprenyl synthetase family protein [Clostridia bacterium]